MAPAQRPSFREKTVTAAATTAKRRPIRRVRPASGRRLFRRATARKIRRIRRLRRRALLHPRQMSSRLLLPPPCKRSRLPLLLLRRASVGRRPPVKHRWDPVYPSRRPVNLRLRRRQCLVLEDKHLRHHGSAVDRNTCDSTNLYFNSRITRELLRIFALFTNIFHLTNFFWRWNAYKIIIFF